ncbi:MAG TPA: ABC transporter substrate-binding protein [Ilumatobacter sp.]|nr:ABC transporter substrate-binding protein [Ilumatobacter sp.]
MRTTPMARWAAVVVGLAFVAGACGDDTETTSTTAATTATTASGAEAVATTDAAEGETTATTAAVADVATTVGDDQMAATPSAIISLSASATEMLYALDAADQILAVDDFSNFPPEAADKMAGLDAFQPNVESIAALEPDLVITDGTNSDFLAQLDSLDIAHWEGMAPSSFDDIYTQVEQLGAVIGRVGEAAELVGQMQTDIEAVIADMPELDAPMTYYHELDNTYFSVTSDTFIGAVYAQAGLQNIADEAGDLGPYPQLSAEFILQSDPDLIFLACTKYCGETAESVADRPGWDVASAVVNGGVIEMDDDIVSRWGPRVVDFLQSVGEAVNRQASVEAG